MSDRVEIVFETQVAPTRGVPQGPTPPFDLDDLSSVRKV